MIGAIASHYVAGGTSVPASIPGLLAWYSADAEAAYYADGASMGTLHDQSGNGNHGTGSPGAIWQATTGPSGGPSIRFDNTTGRYFNLPNLFTGKTSGELFAQIKSDGGATNPSPWNFGHPGTSGIGTESHYPLSNGVVYDAFGLQLGGRQNFTPTLAVTSWRRFNLWSAAADWAARLDETTQATYTGGTVTWDSTPLLGRGKNDNALDLLFKGNMTTVLLYGRKLTTTERSDLSAWMAANPSGGLP